MPIVRTKTGQSVYVTTAKKFSGVYPEHFFRGDDAEFLRRLAEARQRVLEVIRFASVPLAGRGTCHEVFGIGPQAKCLTDFVDSHDGRRAQLLKKQRSQLRNGCLPPHERGRQSPQRISKRRAALFSGTDIPTGYFRKEHGCHVGREERGRFVDLMRWHLFETAILMMYAEDEIAVLNDVWYVKVSVMDAYPNARQQRRRKSGKSSVRVKRDDRAFHGKPNRDRGQYAA